MNRKTAICAAALTATDALKELIAQCNTLHGKVPALDGTLVDSITGTAADLTIGAITGFVAELEHQCLYKHAPTRRNAAQSFCYDGFGHDAPVHGALWQVPARRANGASGRLESAPVRRACQRTICPDRKRVPLASVNIVPVSTVAGEINGTSAALDSDFAGV